MKTVHMLILLSLSTMILSCGGDATVDTSGGQRVSVAFSDVPYQTEKYLRIGYTLKTGEFEKENLELQKIIVLDNDTKAELLVISKEDLPFLYQDPVKAKPFFTWDKLTSYYLSIQLPIPLGQTPPKTVSHRFLFKDLKNSGDVTVEGAQFSPRTNETPLVIASPLKRKNLVFINQATMGYHFYVLFFTNGNILYSERYAFDSMQLSDALNSFYEGDPKVNSSYFNYGSSLLAVADGVVMHIQDGFPENSGDAQNITFKSISEYAGNYIMLDIGGGRYAYYAHCIPNSFRVRIGDRVKEGDPIALLGNSGNSTAPHLHFQITDGPDLFLSRGIPFVLKKFTITGDVTDKPITLPPTNVTNAMMEQLSVFRVE